MNLSIKQHIKFICTDIIFHWSEFHCVKEVTEILQIEWTQSRKIYDFSSLMRCIMSMLCPVLLTLDSQESSIVDFCASCLFRFTMWTYPSHSLAQCMLCCFTCCFVLHPHSLNSKVINIYITQIWVFHRWLLNPAEKKSSKKLINNDQFWVRQFYFSKKLWTLTRMALTHFSFISFFWQPPLDMRLSFYSFFHEFDLTSLSGPHLHNVKFLFFGILLTMWKPWWPHFLWKRPCHTHIILFSFFSR